MATPEPMSAPSILNDPFSISAESSIDQSTPSETYIQCPSTSWSPEPSTTYLLPDAQPARKRVAAAITANDKRFFINRSV